MARLVVAAAAAVVVGYFGGPAAGFATFSAVYGATGFLDPKTKTFGTRLNDLKAPQANYGSPWPYVEGAPRLAGIFLWSTAKREISNTQSQGKGGPGVESTTYTYEVDCIIGLSITQCAAIRKVFSNGKLVWSNGDDADAETLRASALTNSWRDIRFYSGAPDQLPDPTYEAAVGVGNAPAYRGRTTVLIEGLNLGGSGQLPVLTFEVLSEAGAVGDVETMAVVAGVAPFTMGTPAFSLDGFVMHVGQWNNGYSNRTVKRYQIDPDGTVTYLSEYFAPVAYARAALTGNTDESGLLIGNVAGTGAAFCFGDIGDNVVLDFGGANLGDNAARFSKLGNDIVVASTYTSGDKKVRRFDRTLGGSATVTSAAMAGFMQSIAIGGSYVYALAVGGAAIYQLDLATLTLQATIAPPVSGAGDVVVCDEAGKLYLADSVGTAIYSYDGSVWTLLYSGVPAIIAGSSQAQYRFTEGTFFSADWDIAAVHSTVRYLSTSISIVTPTLADVVKRLILRTGQLTSGDIDVTELVPDHVRAMALVQVSTTRQALETLMAAYLFEFVEGEKLKAVKRGGASALTIPYVDLGASSDGNAEPLPIKRLNDVEIPAVVTVKYANVSNDFQDGAETGDRLVTESTAVSVVELPLGFTPAEARRLADANTMDLAVGLMQIGPVALTRAYAALEPTDVVTVTAADGSTFRTRVMKSTVGAGIHTLELVLDDATVVNSAVDTDDTYASSTLVRSIVDTTDILLDIPILRDADDSAGFYVAGKPAGSGLWSGYELDESGDDVTYSKVLDSNAAAVIGVATTTLGDFTDGNVFDERSSLTVNVGAGALTSTTRTAMLAGTANALAVGSDAGGWEIVQFRDATLVSAGVYVLGGFLRGRRGTEWMIGAHVANERVVLLEASSLRRVQEQQSDIGIARYWKAVTFGNARASVPGGLFTDTSVGLKPFAPVDLHVEAGDVVWDRRSRLSSRFLAEGVDPPLGEATEAYDVELRDESDALVDSTTVTTPAYTLPGSYSGYSLTVYMKSSAVGRGYPATLELA